MLSLGARPHEKVISCSRHPVATCDLERYVQRILGELREFLYDLDSSEVATASGSSTTSSLDSSGSSVSKGTNSSGSNYHFNQAPNSRGRMICVLDYCKRAVNKCEEILAELGLWCVAKIARVFVKHLINLDTRRSLLMLSPTTSAEQPPPPTTTGDDDASSSLIGASDDQLSRILRLLATNFCMIVRLCQTKFDT